MWIQKNLTPNFRLVALSEVPYLLGYANSHSYNFLSKNDDFCQYPKSIAERTIILTSSNVS